MELSINQLAELKIAIEKEASKLDSLKDEYTKLLPKYNHTVSETIRLKKEVEDQAGMKDFLFEENKKLREEKDLINGEYEKRNEENYKKLKEIQDNIDQKQEILNLRTLEVEKRESQIFHKQQDNKKALQEIKKLKAELGEERLFIEKISNDNSEKLKEIAKQIKDKTDLLNEIAKKQDELDFKLLDLKSKEREIQKEIEKNNELLIELQSKENINKEVDTKLESFKKFLIEVKKFTLENINKDLTDELKEKYKTIENILLNGVITNDNRINEEDVEKLSSKEIRQVLTEKGIEFNPNNFNKQSLLKLLK